MPLVVLLSVLAVARSVQAQEYPEEMVITLPEVEVRSGPTKEYYATSKLRYGDRVVVLRESEQQRGWLAIKPPQGSFSWINENALKQITPGIGVVMIEGGAMVRPGSLLANKAPTPDVEWIKIPRGSIVTILDKGKTVDGITRLPIEPWHTEAHFIPGEAVQTRLANNNHVNINGGATASPTKSAQNSWNAAQAPGHPTQMAQGNSWVPGQTAVFTQTNRDQQKLAYAPQWSQVGILGRAAFDKDGQPAYVLLDPKGKGQVLMYVSCQPGRTLRDYVGRTVALYGSVVYRSDDFLRTHFMMATDVAVY